MVGAMMKRITLPPNILKKRLRQLNAWDRKCNVRLLEALGYVSAYEATLLAQPQLEDPLLRLIATQNNRQALARLLLSPAWQTHFFQQMWALKEQAFQQRWKNLYKTQADLSDK